MEKENLLDNLDKKFEYVMEFLKKEELRGNSLQRLREAAFFLSKMIETYEKSNDFSHYMTAYIMLSRSVLWILKKEYSHIEGFLKWHNSKAIKGQQEKIFKKVTKLRNQISKVEPLKFMVKAEVIFDTKSIRSIDNIESLSSEEIASRLSEMFKGRCVLLSNDEAKEIGAVDKKIGTRVKIESMTLEHETFQDIQKECKLYFFYIAIIVFECMLKFGIPSITEDN